MTATLRQVAVADDQIAEIGERRHRTVTISLRRRRRRGEIGAAAAGQQLAVLVVDVRLGERELAAHAHHLALRGEIARHGGGVIVDAQIDGRHAAADLLHHRPVGGEIDQRRQHAAMGIAALRIDHPFLAPGRRQLDAVVMHRHDLEAEPLVIGRAGDQRLHAARQVDSSGIRSAPIGRHRSGSRQARMTRHGATTTLPMTSRSWISRSPSRACSSGSTLSITGFILPSAISSISPFRSSS